MKVLLHAPAAELPAEWSWCADCAGTGIVQADPAAPPPVEEDCWTCRGLGLGASHVL
ncbi:hypothetical protein BJ969_000242 [Saccharopolyspora gloriosae]|uniref:Uncharacterized protein n=1 Tax=Saccharopolyspora gloriosae TaxID=455344 RepID=A0A840N672_9PSEU|nr:hypothetical protein [Saccharopolyspora gloriosae]MBB5067154.1 hypothetical protein [Saccharopolyspora gloriosae]